MSFESLLRRIPHWGRVVMNREIKRFLDTLPAGQMRALEISGWAHSGRSWASYRATSYPDFDLCSTKQLEPEAEIVFCEQVLEHLPDPWRATQNLFDVLTPGGWAVVSVPFMVRIHKEPGDYWRFSVDGLRILLERAGFEVVELADWGNRACVVANLWRWCPYIPGLQPLWRSAAVPIIVWAIARRPAAKGTEA